MFCFYLARSWFQDLVHHKMEADMTYPDGTHRIALLNKKRKLQNEVLGMPSPKHVRWGQRLVCSFPCDPKMVRDDIFVESEPESATISYSFPNDSDMSISSHDDAKTHLSYQKSDSTCSEMSPHLSETRSLEQCEQLHSLYRKYGLKIHEDYGVHPLEFEGCVDENGTSFVLSSGRWSVNQDSEEGTKKLTVDKEFEQYFSALMM